MSFVPTVVPPAITGADLTTPVNTPISGSVGNTQVPPGVSYVLEGNPPANGQVTVDPSTGAYTYTPNKDYVGGPETFQIKACLPAPNDTLCSTATVTVTVTPAGTVAGAATPVPTLGHAAMALLGLLLAGLGWGAQRRKVRP